MKKRMYIIPHDILMTQTIDGYFLQFYKFVPDYKFHKEAWLALEEKRVTYGLGKRYSTYESFRNSKRMYMMTKKNKYNKI